MKGLFIVFEGPDGCGKTTQAKRLTSLLNTFHPTEYTRQPGGTAYGEQVRTALLDTDDAIPPLAEILAHFSVRHQHLETYINPLRDQQTWVICDRFVDTTFAYQVLTQGVPEAIYDTLCDWVVGDHSQPDLIIVLDISPATRQERLAERVDERNRHDSMTPTQQDRIAEYLVDKAHKNPQRYLVVDGNGSEVDVFERVLAALSTRIELPYDVHPQ